MLRANRCTSMSLPPTINICNTIWAMMKALLHTGSRVPLFPGSVGVKLAPRSLPGSGSSSHSNSPATVHPVCCTVSPTPSAWGCCCSVFNSTCSRSPMPHTCNHTAHRFQSQHREVDGDNVMACRITINESVTAPALATSVAIGTVLVPCPKHRNTQSPSFLSSPQAAAVTHVMQRAMKTCKQPMFTAASKENILQL